MCQKCGKYEKGMVYASTFQDNECGIEREVCADCGAVFERGCEQKTSWMECPHPKRISFVLPGSPGQTLQAVVVDEQIRRWVLDALSTNEMHHKQWYLHRIREALGIQEGPGEKTWEGTAP